MAIEIAEQNSNRFSYSASGDTVYFKGELDDQNPGDVLDPFFDAVISQMGDSITIDISGLDFLNSSGIKCLIGFLSKRKPGSKVDIKTDSSKTWQATSIKVMQRLDKDNISISS